MILAPLNSSAINISSDVLGVAPSELVKFATPVIIDAPALAGLDTSTATAERSYEKPKSNILPILAGVVLVFFLFIKIRKK